MVPDLGGSGLSVAALRQALLSDGPDRPSELDGKAGRRDLTPHVTGTRRRGAARTVVLGFREDPILATLGRCAAPGRTLIGKPRSWRRPSRSTLHKEIVCLRQVLRTANRRGWLLSLPDMSEPYRASNKISHRAWFSPEEYTRLY